MLIRSQEKQIYPFEYRLEKINIISTLVDKTIDITSTVGEFSLYENLFTNTMTGNVYIQEQVNLISNLPIVGHEQIEITLYDPQLPDTEITHTFRIYSITNVANPNQVSRSYILNFVSEEHLTNLKTSISRSYRQQTISSIVNSICTSDLNLSRIDLEKTGNIHDIVIPNWKPFHAISWLSKRAVSENFEGANYLFYQTREGYSFRCLESLMSGSSQKTYETLIEREERKNIPEDDTRNSILSMNLDKTFDLLENIPTGMYANRLVIHDMIQRKTETLDFNYADSYSNQTHLERGDSAKWGYGEIQGIDVQGSSMLVGKETDQYTTSPLSKQFFISRFDEKNNYTEKTIQNRVSQIQQTQNIKLRLDVAGDITRKVGDVIEIDMDSIQAGGRVVDKMYSGRYLITSLRHLITDGRHNMIMGAMKDSYFNSLPKGK